LRDYSDPKFQIALDMWSLDITGFAGEELNHLYGYVGQNPLFWSDSFGLAKGKNKGKPVNPNLNPDKKKGGGRGTGTRRGDAGRERTQGIDEEHSIKPQNGHRIRGGRWWFIIDPCLIDPIICGGGMGFDRGLTC